MNPRRPTARLELEGLLRWVGHVVAEVRGLPGPRCAVTGCGHVVWWKLNEDEPEALYLCNKHLNGCATAALALAGANTRA